VTVLRNYLNTNDIFPILELIKREIRKNDYDINRVYVDTDTPAPVETDEVESIEVLRGGNTYDPEVIDSVIVTYVGGGMETITLLRGANPPVPNTVPDYEFINNVMISGFQVTVNSQAGSRTVQGEVIRENGYGKVSRIQMTYVS